MPKKKKEEMKFSNFQDIHMLYPISVEGFGIGKSKEDEQILLAFFSATPPGIEGKESSILVVGHFSLSKDIAKHLLEALEKIIKEMEQ